MSNILDSVISWSAVFYCFFLLKVFESVSLSISLSIIEFYLELWSISFYSCHRDILLKYYIFHTDYSLIVIKLLMEY